MTEWIEYLVDYSCDMQKGATLVFQNRLGVPETFHLPGWIAEGQEYEVERAAAVLERRAYQQDREIVRVRSKVSSVYTGATKALVDFEVPALIEQLLASTNVYWLKRVQVFTNDCSEPVDETTAYMPVEIESSDTVFRNQALKYQRVIISWREARGQEYRL